MTIATILSKCDRRWRSLLASMLVHIGGEELGPLRVMMATGAGLSLALNTVLCCGIEGFFFFFPWLSTRASSSSFLSLVSVFASFFMRPQSGILCVVEGGEVAAVEEEERGGGQG